MSLADFLQNNLKGQFTLERAYKIAKDKPKTTVRARIYENLGKKFIRISKGIYRTLDKNCLLVEGDGRKLDMLNDNSVDAIISDHPWESKSNVGGNRNFANQYDCFNYTIEDFKEKARVLMPGGFLVEILPSENESNYEYLYKIKQMAKEAGFLYYSKVAWKKGNFVSNTGRKAKCSEDIMIFSLGKARSLRLDVKKSKKLGETFYMSGTAKMLPKYFDIEPVPKKEVLVQSQKPVTLYEQIIEYISLAGELILDQYAGSGSAGVAALNKNRRCILIEKLKDNVDKIKQRLNMEQIEYYFV